MCGKCASRARAAPREARSAVGGLLSGFWGLSGGRVKAERESLGPVAVIEFSDVSKTYGRPGKVPAALQDVSFSVGEGELALVVGPSGAGKSTLLKLILAMERPESGVIRVAGRDVQRLRKGSIPYLRRNVGAVFQDFKLLPDATPTENVALALHVLGMSRRDVRDRAQAALRAVNLDPDLRKPVRQFSGGEQQRVAVARALAGEPAILLADEPTGNLDPELTLEILALFREIARRGTTVLLATHDPLVMEAAGATQTLRLSAGALVDATGNRLRVVRRPDSGPEAEGDAEAVA